MDITKHSSSCSVCQQTSSKAIWYVCESGHVMCPNCHSNNFNNEGGDCMKSANTTQRLSKKDKNKNKSSKSIKDLASGDYQKQNCKSIPKMTFMYRNIQYRNSSTSTNISASATDELIVKSLDQYEDRPVACPVCMKITALNSVLQHFHFDHSKIPRLTLSESLLGHMVLKISDLNSNTNCLAVIFSNTNKSTGIQFSHSALFMGAKIEEPTMRFSNENINNKAILIHKPLRQDDEELKYKHKTTTKTIKFQDTQDSKLSSQQAKHTLKSELNIVLWICKIQDEEKIYHVTVSSEDEKISYSYTGRAVHIRDKQDPRIIYQKPECLVLRGISVNRLMNRDGYIQAFIKYIC